MSRPTVLLLPNIPNWAYDFVARSIAARLGGRFDIRIAYSSSRPDLNAIDFDLIYIFYWADPWPRRFDLESSRVVREVASWRWATDDAFGPLAPDEFSDRYLGDCAAVTTPARALQSVLAKHGRPALHCPNGFEPALFRPPRRRRGRLRIGWVGNPDDASKGLHDILMPAASGFDFEHSTGDWSRGRVARFYRGIDVLAIASLAESQPLPLIEAMASGCFPVTTDVGIARELVRDGVNGRIVERTEAAFREAFEWCASNLEAVRAAGRYNAGLLRSTRTWDVCAPRFAEVFDDVLAGRPGRVPAVPPQRAEIAALHACEPADLLSAAVPARGPAVAAAARRLRLAAADRYVRWREGARPAFGR